MSCQLTPQLIFYFCFKVSYHRLRLPPVNVERVEGGATGVINDHKATPPNTMVIIAGNTYDLFDPVLTNSHIQYATKRPKQTHPKILIYSYSAEYLGSRGL